MRKLSYYLGMTGQFYILHLIGLSLLLLPCTESVAVMSVDLGSEWMKIAIVSPGVPMEIALNKESKRKTPVTIALRDGERTFGEDAANIGVRFPRTSYSYLLELLGKHIDNPVVELFRQRFPYYDIVADPERNTVLFQHDSETRYSPEQLLAMLLQKAQEFAQESAGQAVNEAVLTVPGFFNQAERRAMLQAAGLAGIKVLQLINDYTAVALNYGIFRRKDFNETAQYIMFYDMGAISTTATIVSYQLVKTKEKGVVETNPQLTILGVGYDRTLGGLEIQLRLRDYLAKKFNEMKKTTNDVFKNPRAMAKLFKESGRVRNVLSANAEHYAQVEGLLDDADFKLLVTRDQLEAMCVDVFDRVKAPVEQALMTSGLDISVISQVILVGAGTRVPKVQERLTEIVGMELGKNINTDEAAAMGAVYKAADLSTGFKVKKFITRDAVLFPVQVVFDRDVEGQLTPKHVKRVLFGPMNPFPQKKVLTFNKHHSDFTFNVNYGELDHLSAYEIQALGCLNLSRVELSGVEASLAKHQASNVESKGIKAHFNIDDSGLLILVGVELVLEKTLTEEELAAQEESPFSKLGSTISKLFTGSDEKKEEIKENKADKQSVEEDDMEKKDDKEEDEKPEAGRKTESESDKKDDKEETKNVTNVTDNKSKVVVIKEPITTTEEHQGITELTASQFREVQKTLDALTEFDRQRSRREGALNALESFVFDAQTKLEIPEYLAAATDAEVQLIQQTCTEMSEWLYEEGSEADAETYEAKLAVLKTLTRPLYRRVKEQQDRPEALTALNMIINTSEQFLVKGRNMSGTGVDSIFTTVEMDTLERIIHDTKEWKAKMEEEQSVLKLSDTPKLTVKSIKDNIAVLDREVKYLLNKAKIWKPRKSKDENLENASINGTETENSIDEGLPEEEELQQSEETDRGEDNDKNAEQQEQEEEENEKQEQVQEQEQEQKAVPDTEKTTAEHLESVGQTKEKEDTSHTEL